MWAHFYSDGGFGMYPITLFGLLFIASAVMLVLRPERKRVSVLISLAAATGGSSVLGFALGIIACCRYVRTLAPEQQLTVLVTGVAEALNMIVLGAIAFVFAGLLCAAAAQRESSAGARG